MRNRPFEVLELDMSGLATTQDLAQDCSILFNEKFRLSALLGFRESHLRFVGSGDGDYSRFRICSLALASAGAITFDSNSFNSASWSS